MASCPACVMASEKGRVTVPAKIFNESATLLMAETSSDG